VVKNIIETYPDDFAIYRIHISDPYELPGSYDEDRWSFYFFGDGYIPRFVVDGLNDMPDDCDEGPNNPCDRNLYESRMLAREPIATDVTISLSGVENSAQTYDFTAQVCVEAGGTDKTVRVYMVDLLDNWPTPSMPPYKTYYKNTLRQAAPTVDVPVNAGSCVDVQNTFTFDADSWDNKSWIKIMAWAQTPASSFPAEVHQAATLPWPDFGDSDGDGIVDGLDNCPEDYNPGQEDDDGDTVGDVCDECPGYDDRIDTDGDGVADGCDECEGDDASGDSDGDGICDDIDECFGDNATGDSDGDGVCDDLDQCWGDDATGDSDGDGVCDDLDECEGDDATGDTDGDGVCDDLDQCWGDDATGDGDGDDVCADLDCDDGDAGVWEWDSCGVCGGDNSTCLLWEDDFETGNTSNWSYVLEN
jgi:hypothetical protein